MNKLIVFGGDGMLGTAVSSYFAKKGVSVEKQNRRTFDISRDSPDHIPSLIRDADLVINCAGIIKQRMGSFSPEEVVRVNSIFPRNLAMASSARGIPMIHITTDCVYSGRCGNYDETSLFDAEDLYGMSKNAGEPSDKAMVLRTSIVGEDKGSNLSLLEWARSQTGGSVDGFTNHLWNGVTTLHLAEIIDRIMSDNLFKIGLFHIFTPEILSKFEMLSIFNKVYELNLTITPITTPNSFDRSLSSIHELSKQLADKFFLQQVKEMRDHFSSVASG